VWDIVDPFWFHLIEHGCMPAQVSADYSSAPTMRVAHIPCSSRLQYHSFPIGAAVLSNGRFQPPVHRDWPVAVQGETIALLP
jgi:hypothetical protein